LNRTSEGRASDRGKMGGSIEADGATETAAHIATQQDLSGALP
jgi:hypothetical protein